MLDIFEELQQKVATQVGESVVIFGACRGGLYHHRVFKHLSIPVDCFADNQPSKIDRDYLGHKVLAVEAAVAQFSYSTFVLAVLNSVNVKEARNQLLSLGVAEDKIKYLTPEVVPLYIGVLTRRNINMQKYGLYKHDLMNHQGLARNTALSGTFTCIITERCNLSCSDCSVFVPENHNPRTFDPDEVIQSVKNYASCFEFVYRVCLMGGEPFLHKDFAYIASEIAKIDNILFIDIATNGTVVPPKGIMQVCQENGLGVEVSDYGLISRKMRQLFDECEREGVVFFHQSYEQKQWFKQEILVKQYRDEATNNAQFLACTEQHTTPHVLGGRLFKCGFSAMLDGMQRIDTPELDYVDLLAGRPHELGKVIKKLFTRTSALTACDFCSIPDAGFVPAGIQTGNYPHSDKAKREAEDQIPSTQIT